MVAMLAFVLAPRAEAEPLEGIHKIQHVVMIMQENHSFDNYFGTYPGANGIPAGTCVPDPVHGGCVKPFYDPEDEAEGGPHGTEAAIADIDGGKMDGFVAQAEEKDECETTGGCSKCKQQAECAAQVMGYHDARVIPNYWTYAQDFVLQDDMFESQASWSAPEHLAMVSGWSALCPKKEEDNPLACVSSLSPRTEAKYWSKPLEPGHTAYPWTDVTYLMHKHGVSWRYYVHEGDEPDCENDEATSCAKITQNAKTPGIWNPLPDFTDVTEDGQLANVQPLPGFYEAAEQKSSCGLPNVSWIVPSLKVSEHPPGLISVGETYVTTLIDTIMKSPCWGSTAIFVSWDDWGGYYDHVPPPDVDENGYGLRVPGLVISPYARAGYIDHQQLSHDAYLKFIEDDFLGGERLNPLTDGRPDSRPHVREEASGLGDMTSDFDFNQSPRQPVLLSPEPAPGPASAPPGSQQPPAVETSVASSVAQSTATLNAAVNPDGADVSNCRFEYGTSIAYGSTAPCTSSPGSGSSPVAVLAAIAGLTANTSYHVRIVATNAGGTSYGPDLPFTTSAEPPAVETGAASSLTQSSATLNATVNPEGATVSACELEYGTSTKYGASVSCAPSPGSGSSPVAVSAAIAGLGAATSYHFRVLATNASGTSYGADREFRTRPNPPTVTAVQPDAGLAQGGTAVTISGSNFTEVAAVKFGSHESSTVEVKSPTSLSATAPAGTGTVDVTVLSSSGTSPASPNDRFTYVSSGQPPSVKALSPPEGPSTGGTTVTVSGANFTGVTAVTFGSTPATSFTVSSKTEILAVTPAEPAGIVRLAVTTPNGTSASSTKDEFEFDETAPALSGIEPALGGGEPMAPGDALLR
jgi:phospholipase C